MARSDVNVNVNAIRRHYDRLSAYYQAFWGEHIHHGYWEGGESVREAQIKLIERLAARAKVPRRARVLDVGCGLGGSAVWLAKNLECRVVGITISQVQASLAAARACRQGVSHLVRFAVADANQRRFASGRFNVIWVVESSEHFADKRRFIESCASLLRPGGILAVCAWLRPERVLAEEHLRLLRLVSRGMLCSLGSLGDYIQWMEAAGLQQIRAEDITYRVQKTWHVCRGLLQKPVVRLLLGIADQQTREFVGTFAAMNRAYAEGIMRYGMLTAKKPYGSRPAGSNGGR